MEYIEKQRYFTSATISAVVAAAMGLAVAMYTYIDAAKNQEKEVSIYIEKISSDNEKLRSQVLELNSRILVLEKEVSQNRALINSLDNNLKLQVEVMKSLLNTEGKQ